MTTTIRSRRFDRMKPTDVYVGRPSEFGNPFHIGEHGTREEVLVKYQAWFLDKVRFDAAFRAKVETLKDKRLMCWCRPAAGFQGELLCHAQVIAGFLDGIPPEEVK